MTATSGPGLALMFEILGVTSGMRLPVVMHLCSRALSAPINILCDHSDAMAMRDQSWVMMFGADPQEAYDQALIAHTIAEHPDVQLPFANVLDGFTVTHSVERVDVPVGIDGATCGRQRLAEGLSTVDPRDVRVGLSAKDVETLLYKKSGLLGISGISNDMRVLLKSSEPAARLAVDYFVYRAAKEIGALAAALRGVDALVFTAGIGENSSEIRERICDASSWLGIDVNREANVAHGPRISSPASRASALVRITMAAT